MSEPMITAKDISFGGSSDDGHVFRRIGEGHYRLSVPAAMGEFDIDRLYRDRHELSGELVVSCGIKGARTFDGLLSTGNFNLSSTRARSERAKQLRDRAHTGQQVDWDGLLEELCARVIQAERGGTPARLLCTYDRPSPADTFEIDGLALLKLHPVMLFGDGGTAKSYLALYLAGQLAQRGHRVLLADWELGGEDHRDRLERLFGPDMPNVLYLRCERPMVSEADRIRRQVDELGVEYLICDSVAFAADGPPESAEVAAGYFRAVRQIGIGSLHVAHVTKPKNDDGDQAIQKPFGSVFWHNSARGTWYVKRAEASADDSRITIGLYNRKANMGPLRAAVGFEFAFSEDQTIVRRVDLADVADLARNLPLWRRLQHVLKSTPRLTLAELAEETGASTDAVKKALSRDKGRAFTCLTKTEDGIHRWALLERRTA